MAAPSTAPTIRSPDRGLSDEQEALRALAERVATERYAPHALGWEVEGRVLPAEERRFLAGLGFLGIALPVEHGGGGADLLDALLVIEELAKQWRPAAFAVFEANVGPTRVVDLFGSEEQRRRFLPRIAAGEATMAVAISEPDAGSAATDIVCRAIPDGDGYLIHGVKRWCSGAGHAEEYLVYVRVDDAPGARGIGAVVVSRDTAGLSFGPPESLMGFRGIASADMVLDGVRVPREDLVVGAGGFGQLFRAFSIERLGNATMSLALAQAALDRCSLHVLEREQFGKPIAEFQLVQAAIADMLMDVEAARLLIRRAAESAGRGPADALEASLAKCFANEMAKRVTDRAMQLHGGYGYAREQGLEVLHRDAHGWAIAGGTPSIQRVRIASEHLQRRFDQRR